MKKAIVIHFISSSSCQAGWGRVKWDSMHLWDYDKKTIKKGILGQRFILERLINFGLDRKKLNKKEVKKHFKYLKLDPKKRDFLKLVLWK